MLREAYTIAIETLSWMEMQRLSEHLALARTIKQLESKNSNAIRYAYRLVVESTRRKNLIDAFVNSVLAPKNVSEFQLGIQSFLRLYVYQTRVTKGWGKLNLQEAEQIASLGRTILGWKVLWAVEPYLGFLLTRKVQPIFESADEIERLSLETFHPVWFVKYCQNLFGAQEATAFLKGSILPPPTYIRLNTLKAPEDSILQQLTADGVQLEKVEQLTYTYRVVSLKVSLNRLQAVKDGLIYIQDKASCFAARAAMPRAGDKVLDVCAAPGAKTTLLAQMMQNEGSINSVDFSKRRMRDWRQEVSHMGVKIADPLIADARLGLPLNLNANLVVLDPPCTSTGVFAKQPSAKWRLSINSIENMAAVQWQMINNCAEKVAPGGFLTYSTCSITLEENELIIQRFLKEHPDFVLVDIRPEIGSPGLHGLTQCQRLYPHIHHCNGFFIAKLKRLRPHLRR